MRSTNTGTRLASGYVVVEHPKAFSASLSRSVSRLRRKGVRVYSPDWSEVAWTAPSYNRGKIDKAGVCLAKDSARELTDEEINDALDIVNNWRSSHGYPLQVLKMTLLKRAKKIDQKAIVAQRIKRMPSIVSKLQRNENMKLSQMHDLGGCRAVLGSVRGVRRLVNLHEGSTSKNPHVRPDLVKKYDYIVAPKPDGYRGIHLVYKYRSESPKHKIYNGLRIEIQLRSRIQHTWATAVETASTFTGQALKSNMGEPEWRRFFALMGSALARREKCPPVPGTPEDPAELVGELRALAEKLSIESVLESWKLVVSVLAKKSDVDAYLLVLDTSPSAESRISVTPYRKEEVPRALDEYLDVEKQNVDNPHIQAVLVSVTSLRALRVAYPNYYLDTSEFLSAFRRVTQGIK